MIEAPISVRDRLTFKDAAEFMSAEDLIFQRIASLSPDALSEGTGRQFHLTDTGKQEARDIFHQHITTSGSYYEQREIIQHLRERRNELRADQARILDRMTSSFQMQTEYVRSIQIAEELKVSPVWQRYVDTITSHSHNTTEQVWRKVAQTVAKHRTEVVEQVALYKVPPHKQYIESLVALRETEAASYQYKTINTILQNDPSQTLDISYQTQGIYGNVERFADSVNDLQLGLEIEKMYAIMEKTSIQDKQRMELIELIEQPTLEEFVLPQQVESIKEYIREETSPSEKPSVTLEKVQKKFKLPKKMVANIVGAAIGIIASWSPIASPSVSSAEQSPLAPPAITLESKTYQNYSSQMDLRYDFMNTIAIETAGKNTALPEADVATAPPQVEHALLTENTYSIETRGILIVGEPGRYVGDYSPLDNSPHKKTIEQHDVKDIYALVNLFSEKQKQYEGHLAIQLSAGTSYSIAIANIDTDKSGAITNRFDVSPQSAMQLEINGIEIFNDGSIAFRLNDTYIGKSKQSNDEKSGASYLIFSSDQIEKAIDTLQNHTQEGMSSAMFAVSDKGSITNLNAGVANLNDYFQNQSGNISMVVGTHLAERNLKSYGYVEGKTVGGTAIAGGVCKAVTLFNNVIARTLEKVKIGYKYIAHKNHSSGAYNPVIMGDTPITANQNEWIDATVAAEAGNAITDLAMSHDGTIHAHGETLYTENLGDGRTASFTVVNAEVTQ